MLWALTACQAQQPVGISTASVPTPRSTETGKSTQPDIQNSNTPIPPTQTATRLPTGTLQIKATEKSTPVGGTIEVQLLDGSICSPLKHETIDSLTEIIGDPYKPPPPGRDERHHGVDFSYYHHGDRDTIEGEGVQAILSGSVAAVVNDRLPYGNMAIIETPASMLPPELVTFLGMKEGESLYHLYAHMQDKPLVSLGESVKCGEDLGNVGMTGYNIYNPHLHLETRIGPAGVTFSGMAFYTTSATVDEMDNYKRWRTSGDFRHFDPMSLFAWFQDH